METTSQKLPIELNNLTISHLDETRKWTLFFSILGFIFMGLCIIIVPILLITSQISNASFSFLTVFPLILVAIIYFFPIYYLLKFSINSKKAIDTLDSQCLEVSFKFLKLHYRFMGIFTIAIIILYIILGLVFVLRSAL
jgi:hypothetical protein